MSTDSTTQTIVVTCISIDDCYRKAVAEAFCGMQTNPCKSMQDNKDFMRAMKMRVVLDGLEFPATAACSVVGLPVNRISYRQEPSKQLVSHHGRPCLLPLLSLQSMTLTLSLSLSLARGRSGVSMGCVSIMTMIITVVAVVVVVVTHVRWLCLSLLLLLLRRVLGDVVLLLLREP